MPQVVVDAREGSFRQQCWRVGACVDPRVRGGAGQVAYNGEVRGTKVIEGSDALIMRVIFSYII